MAAEVALADQAVRRAVEQRAPVLELADPVGRLLRVQLRHPPVVEHLPAAHGVAEVHPPVVLGVEVGHRGGDAALGHDRVRLAEQRLADDRRPRAALVGFDRGPQARTARPDDDDVVLVLVSSSSIRRTVRSEIVSGGEQEDVEVGEGDAEQRRPGELHVLGVQPRDQRPEPVAQRVPGEVVEPAADDVPAGVAGQRVEPEQGRVGQQDQRAEAHVPPRAGLVAEGEHGVVGEDQVEDQPRVEEVPVHVLEDQREPGLAGVAARAARRPRRPAGTARTTGSRPSGSSSRSAGSPAGRPGCRAPGRSSVGPVNSFGKVSPSHWRGEARRVERRDVGLGEVVRVLERAERRVDDEQHQRDDGQQRLEPPAVCAQRACRDRRAARRGAAVAAAGVTAPVRRGAVAVTMPCGSGVRASPPCESPPRAAPTTSVPPACW